MKLKKQKSPRPKFDFCFNQNIARATSILMITVKTENYNHISQDFYNKTMDSLDLNLIPCTCKHSGCLIRYGSYKRNIQLADRVLTLSVMRVFCKACGHTHALLLSSMVRSLIHRFLLLSISVLLIPMSAAPVFNPYSTGSAVLMKTTSNPSSGATGGTGGNGCAQQCSLFPMCLP